MTLPHFAIGEWLVCPHCEIICDAPFRPAGSEAFEPELVLGASLPEASVVPSGNWRVEVAADGPACRNHLVASAVFEGHTLREFLAKDPS
jgi:hypothetical protein